ncbi:hypothetical protein [Enterobacter sichuanensis]|uniref:hypothetical protein n=1 Tax=Enterobacter sichuanensis TaxID=2071710 RepID=UPI002075257D|nr:hypothetical protein [Enterobacter sichuanensis]MCM7883829.1 hypothetical protein [Enterobacter sichuanensis]
MNYCRDCRNPIHHGAKKCHHCGSYQNWIRHLNTFALFTGFFLTLLSIWTIPFINGVFQSKQAEIVTSIISGESNKLHFMIANNGNQPAAITSIEIDSKMSFGIGTWYLDNQLDGTLLEPGQAKVLNASNGAPIPSPLPYEIQTILNSKDDVPKNCTLIIQYVELNGSNKSFTYPFMCSPFEVTQSHGGLSDRQ